MAAVGFDLEEMDDLETGRGEWINTPEIIRTTLKQLILSAQHERRERIKAQETVEDLQRKLEATASKRETQAILSEIAARDEAVEELQQRLDAVEAQAQGLKEALLTKASASAVRELQGSFVTTEELNQVKSQGSHVHAQVERASADVASLTARVSALAKHVDGNDEATSQAIKTHTARFQSDIDRVIRNVERVDGERSSEIQSLSGRIADLHAALHRKADCTALEQTAEAALSKEAFTTHMQAYITRAGVVQRLEPLELSLASVQAGLAGVKDTMQSVQDAASAVTESGIDAAISAQATAIVESAVAQLPSHSTVDGVRHEIEELRNQLAEGLEGRVAISSLDRLREVLLTRDEFEATCFGLARRSDLDALQRALGETREALVEGEGGKLYTPPVHQRLDGVLAELRDLRQALATANIAVTSLQAEGGQRGQRHTAAAPAGMSHSEQLDMAARCKRALDGVEALNSSLHQVSARLDGMARRNEAIARSVTAAQGDANRALATAQECMACDVASSSDVYAVQEQLQSIRARLTATEEALEGGLLPRRRGGASGGSAPTPSSSGHTHSGAASSLLDRQSQAGTRDTSSGVRFSNSGLFTDASQQQQQQRPSLASFMAWGSPRRHELTPAITALEAVRGGGGREAQESMRALRAAVGLSTPPPGPYSAQASTPTGIPHTAPPSISQRSGAAAAAASTTPSYTAASSGVQSSRLAYGGVSSTVNTPQPSKSATSSAFQSPAAWSSANTTPVQSSYPTAHNAGPLRVGEVKHPFGTHSGTK